MQEKVVIKVLQEELKFKKDSIDKLKLFSEKLIAANKSYNFISKNTENDIWARHILDSAQLVKFIDFNSESLSDIGTGGGKKMGKSNGSVTNRQANKNLEHTLFNKKVHMAPKAQYGREGVRKEIDRDLLGTKASKWNSSVRLPDQNPHHMGGDFHKDL